MNKKTTSGPVTKLAAVTLQDDNASRVAKRLAGSALSQAAPGHQTGAQLEDLASRVLQGDHYADTTKTLAASVLAQSVKER